MKLQDPNSFIQVPKIITKTLFKEFLDLPVYAWYHIHDREKYNAIQTMLYGQTDHVSQNDLEEDLQDVEQWYLKRFSESDILDLSIGEGKRDLHELDQKTRVAIQEKASIIYQGWLMFGHTFTIFDVLEYVPASDAYRLVEIKSVTGIRNKDKDKNLTTLEGNFWHDLSYSAYILRKNQINITECAFVYLDKAYAKQWPFDPAQLTKMEIILDPLMTDAEIVPVLEKIMSIFDVSLDEMKKQYPFEGVKYSKYFATKIPTGSICMMKNMSRKRYMALQDRNIQMIGDIQHKDLSLFTELQQSFILSYQKGLHWHAEIMKKLFSEKLVFPLHFYDYETYTCAVPWFHGSHPWQQVVCQYSLHTLHETGEIEHFEGIIQPGKTDNRDMIWEMMTHVGIQWTYIVWNAIFENSRNAEMQMMYPEFSGKFDYMIDHTFDLMDIFRNHLYCDPAFQWSHSIKAVLPIMTDISYADMPVGNGLEAMTVIENILHKTATNEEVQNCLSYCKQDTWAMVAIYQKLLFLVDTSL